MEVLEHIPFKLDLNTIKTTLHINERSEDTKHLQDFAEEITPIVKHKDIYDVSYLEDRGYDTVTIGGVTFTSRALRGNPDKVERVFPYIATCGRELEEINPAPDDFVKRFWLDTIKAVALSCSIAYLNDCLKRKYALLQSSAMSPGAADKDIWPIEQQRELFSVFPDVEDLIGVRVTESCLMVPNKSVSGIRFPTEISFESCQLCRRENCPSRRTHFDKNKRESLFVTVHSNLDN